MTEQELLNLQEGDVIVERDTGLRYRVSTRYARLVVVAPCVEDDTLILGAEHANQWRHAKQQALSGSSDTLPTTGACINE